MRLTRKDTQRQTRDRLIAAAHSSIVEEGVAAMSIRNICNAAGHSQGAFYSNFASKDDLLVEILQAHIHDEVTLLRDLVAHCTGDDIEATLQVLAARLAKLADERNGRCSRSNCSSMPGAIRLSPSGTGRARRPAIGCLVNSLPI
jgi:AcrR family transcriptional regulator